MIDRDESNEVVTKKITIESGSVQGATASFALLTSAGLVDPAHGGTNSTLGTIAQAVLVDSSDIAAASTGYIGSRTNEINLFRSAISVSVMGTIMRFDTFSQFAPGAGQTYTYTLQVNGVDSTMTHTISGAGSFQGHSTGAIGITSGSYVSAKVVTTAAATVGRHAGTLAILTTGI